MEYTKKMRQEASLANVPCDIMIDIISRLPVKTIVSCKSVCKSWLNLLTSPEFVKCHLSKSKPGLVFSQYKDFDFRKIPSLHYVVELESYNAITAFDIMEFSGSREDTLMLIGGSVNGLMFCRMVSDGYRSRSYYVCNPITREYIELPRSFEYYGYAYCGFGVSKIKGQYKMVRLWISYDKDDNLMCEVYTLGTRSWRTVPIAAPGVPPLKYCPTYAIKGTFLNGNLHWLAKDFGGRFWILCFDLETELFSAFSTPVRGPGLDLIASGNSLHLLEDDLNSETFVWSMKEYGVDESWTKKCVISLFWRSDGQSYRVSRPINVFGNDDVLIELYRGRLLYYSSKSKTCRVVCISMLPTHESYYIGILHSPSFLSLKSFAIEDNVKLLHSSGSTSNQRRKLKNS